MRMMPNVMPRRDHSSRSRSARELPAEWLSFRNHFPLRYATQSGQDALAPRMPGGEVMGSVGLTIVLALVAAITAGLWLSILMWAVGFVVNQVNLRRIDVDAYDYVEEIREPLLVLGSPVMGLLAMVVAF